MREWRTGEHARAVVRILVAIGAEDVIVGAILIIMLEKVVHARGPLDQLTLLEFVQLVADVGCVLRMRDKEKQDVVKKVVCREDTGEERRYE